MNVPIKKPLAFILLLLILPLQLFAKDASSVTLIDQNGNDFSLDSLKGKVVLMAYGFTNCPHICPIEMGRMGTALRLLEPEGEKVHGVFITVDRERDTPEAIKKFIANYHSNITGLTGTKVALDEISQHYRIRKSTGGSGDQIDHDTSLYILNAQGEVEAAVPSGLPPLHIVKLVKNLLNQ